MASHCGASKFVVSTCQVAGSSSTASSLSSAIAVAIIDNRLLRLRIERSSRKSVDGIDDLLGEESSGKSGAVGGMGEIGGIAGAIGGMIAGLRVGIVCRADLNRARRT
jgi:hypothetical protein